MAILERRTLLLAKEETTYGQDANPDPTVDAIEITDFNITPNIETVERNLFRDTLSPVASLPAKSYTELTFSVEIKGNGSQQDGSTTPRLIRLLEACGFSTTAVPESTAGAGDGYFILKPTSSNFKSLTFYAYLDGVLYKVFGARGTVQVQLEANNIGKYNFTFQGLFEQPIDATFPTNAVYEAPSLSPPVVKGVDLTMSKQAITGEAVGTGDGTTTVFTLASTPVMEESETVYLDGTAQTRNTDYTIDYKTGQITFTTAPASGVSITADYKPAYVPCLASFEVTLNNDMVQRDCMILDSGVGDVTITARNPQGSLEPDMMLASEYDVWTDFVNQNPVEIRGILGKQAGNKFELIIPKAVYSSIGIGARDNIRTYSINFTAIGEDDEVQIKLF